MSTSTETHEDHTASSKPEKRKPRHVWIPREVWIPAAIKANSEGKTISKVIRELLEEYLARP